MNNIFVLLLLLLLGLMILVGGKTGLKSYLSIIINALLIILVALLISWGINTVSYTHLTLPTKA